MLFEFGDRFAEYQEAIAQAQQAPPVDPKKPPPKGAPPPVIDLDANLPVPSKQCLEATLRCLTSLATLSSGPAAWLVQAGQPGLLVPLLQHHSPRVQLRAVQCMRALGATSAELLTTLMVHELVPELLRLLRTSTSGAVLNAASQALLSACQQGPGAASTQVQQQGAVDTLLQLVLAPEVLPAPPKPPAADGAAAGTTESRPGTATGASPGETQAAPVPIDYARLPACRPQDLQQSAAALLLHLTTHSLEAATQLLAAGAPNLLIALLPTAPKPAPPADPVNLLPPVPPAPETPTPFFPLPAAASEPPAEEGQPPAAGEDGEASPPPPPAHAEGPEPSILQRLAYPLPATKAASHALQASLLRLLALLLSTADVREAVWQASESSPLVPFLLYFLAEAPAQPPAEVPVVEAPARGAKSAKGAKPLSAKGTPRAVPVSGLCCGGGGWKLA